MYKKVPRNEQIGSEGLFSVLFLEFFPDFRYIVGCK